MKKIYVLSVVACVLASARTAIAVPVVPNFTQGAMTSTTETTSTVTETINSMNYDTGYQYVITGTNVEMDGTSISPTANVTTENTIDGVTSTWTGLDLNTKPNFTMTSPGAAFQFTESYSGPGLKTQTIIQRTTTIQSVTNTTSTFSN
jgi:PP-loop superfamily ATP-utilizing enzyme